MRQPIWGTQTLHPMQAAVLGPQQVLKNLDCITSRPHIEHRQALLENCNASVLSSRQCQSMSGCTCSSPAQERPSLRVKMKAANKQILVTFRLMHTQISSSSSPAHVLSLPSSSHLRLCHSHSVQPLILGCSSALSYEVVSCC
jgi:hypothetical protein